MEKQGADAGKEQGGLDGQGQPVALHQNGHQHGGPKHGKHVLKAQNQHLGQAQLPGVTDGVGVVHFVLLSLAHKKRRFPLNRQAKIETEEPPKLMPVSFRMAIPPVLSEILYQKPPNSAREAGRFFQF